MPAGSNKMSRQPDSFLSSSSTLFQGAELISDSVDEVVDPHFRLDDEEAKLKARLEARKPWGRTFSLKVESIVYVKGLGALIQHCHYRPSTRSLNNRILGPGQSHQRTWTSCCRLVGCDFV